MATSIVRSRRDLAKPYLQVVHSGVLASSDSPVTPRPNKCQTCAWHLGRQRVQQCFAQKLGSLDFQGRGSLDLGEICQFRAPKCFAFQFSQSHLHTLPRELPLQSITYSGGDQFGVSSRPRARARHHDRQNLLKQVLPLATPIVRSRRDLAKPYLQVVHSGVLASSDSPVTPRPNKCHTVA